MRSWRSSMSDAPMPRQQSLTLPLFLWLVPQLLTLSMSAMRVPLSAHPPRPIESVALQQMIVVQIVAMAMLSPILFRSLASTVAVVFAGAPMLALAAFLSWVPLGKWLPYLALAGSWAAILRIAQSAN